MAVTGADEWYLCIWRFGQPLKIFQIQRDEGEIEALIQAEEAFWQLVQSKTPPEIDGSDSTEETLRLLYPADQVEDGQVRLFRSEEIQEWKKVRDQIKDLESKDKYYKNLLKADLGSAEVGIADDFKVTWKSYPNDKFDEKAFAADHPDLYQEYLNEGSYRKFIPYFKKERKGKSK